MGDDIGKFHTMDGFIKLARGYMPSRIFLTALELGVFSHLGSEDLSAFEMADRINTDVRATEVLLNAMVGMNILEKKGDRYSNPPAVRKLLDPASDDYRGGGLYHTANLWHAWSFLTEVVKRGRPAQRDWTPGMSSDLAMAMADNMGGLAEQMTKVVDFSNIHRLLDLGGGPGSLVFGLARMNPNLHGVIFDKDVYALGMAEKGIKEMKLMGRVQVRKGDFLVEDIGKGYDAVFMSFILCLFGLEENALLIEKIYAALEDGGRVIIREALLDESRNGPVFSAMFAVNMLVTTPNGHTYTYAEIKDLLKDGGFKDIYRIPMQGTALTIGRK